MNGLPYYKAYPRDFIEGTIGMPFEDKGAYRLVLDLIYMQGGELPDDPRYISGLLGCSVRKWSAIRSRLVESGKLTVIDGLLTNYRAVIELQSLRKLQDKMREIRAGSNENNDLKNPTSNHTEPESDSSEAYASGADGAEDHVDFEKAIFDRGVKFLCQHGTPESSARSVIGKWRKDHPAETVFQAFADAKRAGVTDPKAFIAKKLNGKSLPDIDALFAGINPDGSLRQ